MRRCYQVVLSLIFVVVALSITTRAQQSAYYQEVFTGPRAGARVHSGVATGYHQIAWETSGGPGACLLALDYSEDGMVWYLGSTIPIHDCTTSGTSIVAGPQNVNFVRMNMNALSTGSAVRATYTGFQTNPGGPTGTVTSVFGRTGQIQAQAGDYSVALITGAAPLFSPNFQGQPTAPTPAPGDNSTLVATTAFVAQALAGCCGGGGGGAVTSVFSRTGAITAQANDYNFAQIAGTLASGQLGADLALSGNPTTTTQLASDNSTRLATTAFVHAVAAGGGGGGGGVTPGTVNDLGKYSTTTTIGPSLATDDGTTFNYAGTGGIVAPKITMNSVGPFELTSVTGALPSPVTGQNVFVSGTDGWYVSNNGNAFIGPLGVGGGGGGAVSSVFGRTGAVAAATNDYTVAQVTGAAPLASPAFTGTPTAGPTGSIPATDSSTRLATTEWVKANFAAGGGGPSVPIPIAHSSGMSPVCEAQSSGTTFTMSTGINILAGDTVLVAVSFRTTTPPTSVTVQDSGGSVYTIRASNTAAGRPTFLLATDPNTAHASTTVTISPTPADAGTQYYIACVASYVGVSAFAQPFNATPAPAASTSATISIATQDNNNFIFGMTGIASTATLTQASGTRLAQAIATTGGASAAAICENSSPTPATVQCGFTFTSVANASVGIELRCCAMTPGAVFTGPKVVGYHKATITATTTATTDVPFYTCSATDCPPGYYRITWDFLSLTSCTNGQVIVNIDYYDEFDLTTPLNTGIGSLSNIGPGRNHTFWTRLQTVAQPFSSTVGINFTTSTTPCSSGTGTAQQVISIERLQ